MSKAGILRALVTQRLTEVVEEICGLFETTIAEYEDLVSRSKEEAEQQRKLLEAVVSAGVDLHKTDIKQLFSVKEEQQEWRSILNQNTPELSKFKKEPEEYSSSQEGPLSSTFAGVHVKSASQKGPQEFYPHVLKVFPGNINQLMICKEEAPSEHQEGRTTLKEGDSGHPLIEEEQRSWSSQEGKWNGKDKEKAHQRRMEENRESPASSSAQQMETDRKDRGRAEPCLQSDSEKTLNSSDSATEDSDDDWERMPKLQLEFKQIKNIPGSETKKMLGPAIDLKPTSVLQPAGHFKFSGSSETEDSDDDWNNSNPEPHLATVKRSFKSSCKTEKTSLCCSTCSKKFHCKEQLRKHTRTHSREMPYQCSECDKQFIHKANLRDHMRSHSFETC